jgi:hypothetical protein
MAAYTHLIAPVGVLSQTTAILPEFLSSQRHPVHAKRTHRRRRVEEPRQFWT